MARIPVSTCIGQSTCGSFLRFNERICRLLYYVRGLGNLNKLQILISKTALEIFTDLLVYE